VPFPLSSSRRHGPAARRAARVGDGRLLLGAQDLGGLGHGSKDAQVLGVLLDGLGLELGVARAARLRPGDEVGAAGVGGGAVAGGALDLCVCTCVREDEGERRDERSRAEVGPPAAARGAGPRRRRRPSRWAVKLLFSSPRPSVGRARQATLARPTPPTRETMPPASRPAGSARPRLPLTATGRLRSEGRPPAGPAKK